MSLYLCKGKQIFPKCKAEFAKCFVFAYIFFYAWLFLCFFCTFAGMKLHIFNPEHDIALACNLAQFTPPHAARQLRADLGFLPALWADDGDFVLVDNVESALIGKRHLTRYMADVCFVGIDSLKQMQEMNVIPSPWGWDKALAHRLRKAGLTNAVPSDDKLGAIRIMSSRQWAAEHLLKPLVASDNRYVGEAIHTTTFPAEITALPRVLKAPWSSSGRGIRYEMTPTDTARHTSWARNVISRQTGLMVEPYFNKVEDFGMEFESLSDGTIVYRGLSLFRTTNGAYNGSIIATEKAKQQLLSRYVSADLLQLTQNRIINILTGLLKNFYEGPFGVDMMIVTYNGEIKLHPCVELNLRRTMGHVALSFDCDETMPQRLMRIYFTEGHHKMRLLTTGENLLNTSMMK